jgi:two-component system response regulator HydG
MTESSTVKSTLEAPLAPPREGRLKDRVLLVDDDEEHCEALSAVLEELGYAVVYTTFPRDALDRVGSESFSAILTDLGMVDMDGLELCARIVGTRPDVPVIVVTGNGSMDVAVSAMRAGAYDFLTKPIDDKLLALNVARAVRHHALQNEVKELREAVLERTAADRLVGDSPAMKRMRDLLGRVGSSDISVLIEGETGTGKELVARALHAAGARRDGPFVAINCGAIPENLLESELFGHVRGAFTGANAARVGLLVKASGGTLFLDEIGDMPLEMQTKLLRALQERTVRAVGSSDETPFDARIIAATHRNLEAEVAANRFREDLFYRVNVVKVPVPPLRRREGDILRLATHFLGRFAARGRRGEMQISPQFAAALLAYEWPGNVRELENCMERAVALARLDHLSVEDLPDKVVASAEVPQVASSDDSDEILTLEEMDRRYIARAIALLDGNKSRAADLLGVDRRTLYRRLEKYEAEQRPGSGPSPEPRAIP